MLLHVLVALIAAVNAQFPDENGVLVLGDDNFDSALSKYEFVLADFYAPWCGHCVDLAPKYAQAARQVRNSQVQFAKIDCTKHHGLCHRYGINGYPTIKFFSNGNHVEYTGGRTPQEIVDWVKKRIATGSTEVRRAEQLRQQINQHQVLLVFFGEEKGVPEYNVFQQYARKKSEQIPTFHILNAEVAQEFKVPLPSIVLFKQFDERKVVFDDHVSYNALENFVETHQYPTLMTFDYKTAQRIFGGSKPTLVLLTNPQTSKAEKQIRLASAHIKDKILLCLANAADHYGNHLATYFSIDHSTLPKLFIVEPFESGANAIKFEEELTSQNIINFVNRYGGHSEHSTDL